MEIFHGTTGYRIDHPMVTIGSFDGVHLGHVKVLELLLKEAEAHHCTPVVITFDTHPRKVIYPFEGEMGVLSTFEEKVELLKCHGIEKMIVLSFTPQMATMSYYDFVKNILVGQLHIEGIVVGYDHHFGRNREGNFDNLRDLSKEFRFSLVQQPPLEKDHANISSTKIRNALNVGDIETVNSFLGYDYSFSGHVILGQQLGRRLGFRTANIQLDNSRKLLPARGVYAVRVKRADKEYEGMMNIGYRPTVNTSNHHLLVEVHIFHFNQEIYGERLTVSLVCRIRGEQKFDNTTELKTQLAKDKADISERFAQLNG